MWEARGRACRCCGTVRRSRRNRVSAVSALRGGGRQRVLFTPWGSFYGPALFHHVRCPECRYAYNGRSGGSNLIPAILFVVIPAVLMAAIIVFIVLLILPHL